MHKLAIVFAAATAVAACNNSTEQTTAVHSVDSAASAAPDTIKAAAPDTGVIKLPAKSIAADTAK